MNRSNPFRNKALLAGGALFLLALAVRLVYLWEVSRSPTFHIPIVDAGQYDRLARSLAEGQEMSPEFFWQVIFYPFFLSGVYMISGSSIVFAKVVQAVLGAVTCVLVLRLGRRIFDFRTGVMAGAITAFYGPVILFGGELLATSWAVFWAVLLLLLLLRAIENPSFKLIFLLGVCGGLSIVTRATFLVFIAASFLWLMYRLRKGALPWRTVIARGGLLLAGILLVVIPVAMKCRHVTGRFSFLPETGSVNLYIGNNSDRESLTPPRPGAEWVALLKEPIRRGILGREEKQRFFQQRVQEYVAGEPLRFLGGMLRKTVQFFTSREIPNNLDLYDVRSYSKLLSPLFWKAWGFGFPFGLLLPLTLLGLIFYFRKIPVPVLLFLIVYPLSVILVFVTARYRAPITTVMAPLAAAGLLHVIDAARSGRWRKAAGLITGALVIAALSSVAGPFAAERIDFKSEMFFCLGGEHHRQGRLDKAVEHLQAAIRMNPDYASAYHQMGQVRFDQNKLKEAIAYYEKALAIRPDMDHWHFQLGQALFRLGDPQRSLLHYREAARLNPNDVNYQLILGDVLAMLGRSREALTHYRQALEFEPNLDSAHYNMGNLLLMLGEDDPAVHHYREALRINPEQTLYCHNLASALTRLGKLEEAVAFYEKALAADPALAQTRYDLGKVLNMLGRTEEALRHWKKALERASASGNHALAEEIRITMQAAGG